MKKRILSALLAVVLLFGVAMSANANSAAEPLKFNNGEFKILHLTDCQDLYPADEKMIKFTDAVLKKYQPDIVVLGGDNSVAGADENDSIEEFFKVKDSAIKELADVFVKNETYFTLVFGNHDNEQKISNDDLLKLYQKHGGKYCLATDPIPELHGCGTHMLPVLSSDGQKTAFAIYMFDSGNYVEDANGNRLGYDSVTPDQIEWYENTSKTLEALNGAKVPAFSFQHIVVGDVYDALFRESSIDMGELSRSFNGKTYSFLPKTENFTGHLFEFPCPGYYNHGQFDAMVARGDMLATFSGHDHVNSYETELKGIKIINTPGATYHSYGNDLVRGARIITVKENDTWNFESEVVTISGLALDNADFASDAGVSPVVAALAVALDEILLALSKASAVISNVISLIA